MIHTEAIIDRELYKNTYVVGTQVTAKVADPCCSGFVKISLHVNPAHDARGGLLVAWLRNGLTRSDAEHNRAFTLKSIK